MFKAANGKASAEYARDLCNLGTVDSDWANETGDKALREKDKVRKEKMLGVMSIVRGLRHLETVSTHNNFAIMKAELGDMTAAADLIARALAIDLSLDLQQVPLTQICFEQLFHFYGRSGQTEVAAPLTGDEGSE